MSQRELARISGITQTKLSAIENSRNKVRQTEDEVLEKIAFALGVELKDIKNEDCCLMADERFATHKTCPYCGRFPETRSSVMYSRKTYYMECQHRREYSDLYAFRTTSRATPEKALETWNNAIITMKMKGLK